MKARRIRRHAWVMAKLAELVARRSTSFARTLPTVFILGATKSASTSLTNMLWHHPAHVSAFAKELMYLQQLPNFENQWEFRRSVAFVWGRISNGHARYSLAGYRKFFPLKLHMLLRAISQGQAVTSECDPFNLYCPTAQRRIEAFAKDPRFIISMRNPIDRAYSDYNMHATRMDERRSFEQCIEDELSGRETQFRKQFLNQSVYEPHVRRWIEAFGRERFLILKAEDLFADPERAAAEMFRFLNLPDAPTDLTPTNTGRYAAKLSTDTRARLAEYFAPHNERLFDLVGWKHDLD
ncbi:MAG TPA: sulfotransferase domain-containing protein [Vicinamibacterales bacterium]|nr:sulfotransferase domain-containing protein [Vicinamibacterales bacterium]